MTLTGDDVHNGVATRVATFEATLVRIPGVRSAKVVVDGAKISEVHVLADQSRPPKQVVRDVQSALQAGFGIDVDYRAVSVVQLESPPEPPSGNSESHERRRYALGRLSTETTGHLTTVDVTLELGGETRAGRARGPAAGGSRLVALAVLDAFGGAVGAAAADVEAAQLIQTPSATVALVVLRLITSRGDHVTSGSAVVRKDGNDAIARAALAAINRLVDAEV